MLRYLMYNWYRLPLDFFFNITSFSSFWNTKTVEHQNPRFFSIFQLPIFSFSLRQTYVHPMSGLDKTRCQSIFRHCLDAVLGYFLWKSALNCKIWAENTENSNKIGNVFYQEMRNRCLPCVHVMFKHHEYLMSSKGENLDRFKPPSILILTVPRRYFCCGSLLLLVLAVRIYTLVHLILGMFKNRLSL